MLRPNTITKNFLLLALLSVSLFSCELLEEEATDDNNDIQNIPDEQLYVRHANPSLYEPPTYNMTDQLADRTFESAYWNNGVLRFNDDSYGYTSYVQVENININGPGQYPILNQPFGKIALYDGGNCLDVYKTDVVPLFWTDGNINSGTLVEGGIGYDLSDYDNVPEPLVVQGGYLVITDYNQRYIAGELFMIAWHFCPLLNREVGYSTYIEFSGVPYQN